MSKEIRLTIRLTEPVHKKLTQLALGDERSLNKYIQRLLDQYLRDLKK